MRYGANRIVAEMLEKGYITISDLSRSWGMHPRAASNYMRRGMIDDCLYVDEIRTWFAPIGTLKPTSERLTSLDLRARDSRPDPVLLGDWAKWPVPKSNDHRSYGWFGA